MAGLRPGGATKLTTRGRRAVAVLVGVAVVAVIAGLLASRGPHIVVPDDPCATPPPLRTVQGVTLQPLAMRAFQRAERLAGRRIEVVQSYRSCAKQAVACRNICGNALGCPDRCARPGRSYHQLGAAIDITAAELAQPVVPSALERAGWCQALPSTDPGHFSFDGCH